MTTRKAFYNSPARSVKVAHYFEIYDFLFSQCRGTDITFVEIGVLGGGSLFMWRDFLGPKARIIGIDLNPSAKKWEKHGFEIYVGDQSDPAFWQELKQSVDGVDVILDDGGHTYLQQITTVREGKKLLNSNGSIVIEDTQTSYQSGFGNRKFSFINWSYKEVEKMNQRSGVLGKAKSSSNWSICFFEGIVVFRFSNNLSPGQVIDNGKPDEHILDYRYKKNEMLYALDSFSNRFARFGRIPGLLKSYRVVRACLADLFFALSAENRQLKRIFRK